VGETEIQKYLSAEFGQGFCPSRQSIDILSDGHVEIKYHSINFTFEGKKEEEFIEWTGKDMADTIAWNISCQLQSKNIHPSSVQHDRVVAGGDHGDVAFQFRVSVHIEISDGSTIYFEVSVLELICRKDTAKLIEATILPGLTSGLKKVATLSLHIHHDEQDGKIHCKFSNTSTILSPQHLMTIEKVDYYITGDLAFQAMSMGRESMARYWCMHCLANRPQFLGKHPPWLMEDLCHKGNEAVHQQNGKPQMGVQQRPWFDFIPVSHHMVPLLHCEIGIRNDLLKMLRNIINKFLENMTLTEVSIQLSIPALRNIIAETATKRDEWDASTDGKMHTTLKRTNTDEDQLKQLEEYRRKTFVDVLRKTHQKVGEQLDKLKKI
jgi:hypothetical protein